MPVTTQLEVEFALGNFVESRCPSSFDGFLVLANVVGEVFAHQCAPDVQSDKP